MMSRKRVAFIGAVGYNLGDEAIAVSAARYIRMLDVDDRIDMWIGTLKPGVIEKRYPDLREFVVNRRSLSGWLRLYEFIRSLDIVVLGGGTLIQDKLGVSFLKGMLAYVFQVTKLAKLLRKPVLTLPIGVDELNTQLGRYWARKVLANIDFLLVRDERSAELACRYGGDGISPFVAADPAFLLEEEIVWDKNQGFPGEAVKGEYVAVSLVNENLPHSNYKYALIETLAWLLKTTKLNIVFVPMDTRDQEEISLFKSIVVELENRCADRCGHRLHILSRSLTPFQAAQVIRGAKLLIGMRLHALIFGVGYVPLLGISRTTKTATFLEEFGQPYVSVYDKVATDTLISLVKDFLFSTSGMEFCMSARKLRREKVARAKWGIEMLLSRITPRESIGETYYAE